MVHLTIPAILKQGTSMVFPSVVALDLKCNNKISNSSSSSRILWEIFQLYGQPLLVVRTLIRMSLPKPICFLLTLYQTSISWVHVLVTRNDDL